MHGCEYQASTVQITQHTAHALVMEILHNSLTHVLNEIDRLTSKSVLLDHEAQDLAQAQAMHMHIQAVIKYHTPPDPWHSLIADVSARNKTLSDKADQLLTRLTQGHMCK